MKTSVAGCIHSLFHEPKSAENRVPESRVGPVRAPQCELQDEIHLRVEHDEMVDHVPNLAWEAIETKRIRRIGRDELALPPPIVRGIWDPVSYHVDSGNRQYGQGSSEMTVG